MGRYRSCGGEIFELSLAELAFGLILRNYGTRSDGFALEFLPILRMLTAYSFASGLLLFDRVTSRSVSWSVLRPVYLLLLWPCSTALFIDLHSQVQNLSIFCAFCVQRA